MDEPRPEEWANDAPVDALPPRTVLVSRSVRAEPVAERLRAAGWTVIWAPSPGARRAAGARPAEG